MKFYIQKYLLVNALTLSARRQAPHFQYKINTPKVLLAVNVLTIIDNLAQLTLIQSKSSVYISRVLQLTVDVAVVFVVMGMGKRCSEK